MSKCSKGIYYKDLLVTYFVQTCRYISIYNGMFQGLVLNAYQVINSLMLSVPERNRRNEEVLLSTKL